MGEKKITNSKWKKKNNKVYHFKTKNFFSSQDTTERG